jgi:hypothetical protein
MKYSVRLSSVFTNNNVVYLFGESYIQINNGIPLRIVLHGTNALQLKGELRMIPQLVAPLLEPTVLLSAGHIDDGELTDDIDSLAESFPYEHIQRGSARQILVNLLTQQTKWTFITLKHENTKKYLVINIRSCGSVRVLDEYACMHVCVYLYAYVRSVLYLHEDFLVFHLFVLILLLGEGQRLQGSVREVQVHHTGL